MLVDDKKVTWSAFRKIRLRQDVLYSRDRTHFTLVIDVLQLMHLVGLINDPITLFKVNQFVLLGSGARIRRLGGGERIGR